MHIKYFPFNTFNQKCKKRNKTQCFNVFIYMHNICCLLILDAELYHPISVIKFTLSNRLK